MYMSVLFVHTALHMCSTHSVQKRALESPEVELYKWLVANNSLGVGNWTQTLCQSWKCSYPPSQLTRLAFLLLWEIPNWEYRKSEVYIESFQAGQFRIQGQRTLKSFSWMNQGQVDWNKMVIDSYNVQMVYNFKNVAVVFMLNSYVHDNRYKTNTSNELLWILFLF